MVELELIKKILWGDGTEAVDLSGFKLLGRLLKGEEDLELVRKIYATDFGIEVDRNMLLDYINCYGLDNIYVGERINYYSNGVLKLRSMQGASLLPERTIKGKKSLFKHEKGDYYYYDLLDDDRRCEQVSPDIFYIRDGCDNMKRISSVLEKPKEKVRR